MNPSDGMRRNREPLPARQLVRQSLPVLPCAPDAGIEAGSFADLEAILQTIERRKGSPVARIHPGLIGKGLGK